MPTCVSVICCLVEFWFERAGTVLYLSSHFTALEEIEGNVTFYLDCSRLPNLTERFFQSLRGERA